MSTRLPYAYPYTNAFLILGDRILAAEKQRDDALAEVARLRGILADRQEKR